MKVMNLVKGIVASVAMASAAHAAVITVADGHHNIEDGFNGIPSLTSLGHTVSYVGTNQASIFNTAADAVIIEQKPYLGSFDMSSVNSYLASGGHIIQFGGSSGSYNLFDQIYGTNFGNGSWDFFTTLAPTGSSYFDSFTPTAGGVLDYESSSHGYNTADLLSEWGGTSVFSDGGVTSVWTGEYNGGLLTYLGYDYCCGSRGLNTQAQWVEVLDFAIDNGQTTAVSESSTLALFGLGLLGLGLVRRK